jgi:hypothetical protein
MYGPYPSIAIMRLRVLRKAEIVLASAKGISRSAAVVAASWEEMAAGSLRT